MRGTKKRSVYFPQSMLEEIECEMQRQERTLSWLVQQAWRIAGPTIRSFPAVRDLAGRDVA
jgi:uncharacterized small protein (TIGR04563 family)